MNYAIFQYFFIYFQITARAKISVPINACKMVLVLYLIFSNNYATLLFQNSHLGYTLNYEPELSLYLFNLIILF